MRQDKHHKLIESKLNRGQNNTKLKTQPVQHNIQLESKGTKKNFRDIIKKTQQLNNRTQTVKKLAVENEFVLSTSLKEHISYLFACHLGIDPVKHNVVEVMEFMLDKEKQYRSITVQDLLKFSKSVINRRQQFAGHIYAILELCWNFKLGKSMFATCYLFYKQFMERKMQKRDLQYALVAAVFSATKYHQIYPPYLVQILQYVNVTLKQNRVFDRELQLMNLISFHDFYIDDEVKWLQLLAIILNLKEADKKLCFFVLRIGLNTVDLYLLRPSLKAFAAITLYLQNSRQQLYQYDMCRQMLKVSDQELKNAIKHYKSALQYNGAINSANSYLYGQYNINNKWEQQHKNQ